MHTHNFILTAAASRGQRALIFSEGFVPGQGVAYTEAASETLVNAQPKERRCA
jgi:hypothetical protein